MKAEMPLFSVFTTTKKWAITPRAARFPLQESGQLFGDSVRHRVWTEGGQAAPIPVAAPAVWHQKNNFTCL